MTRIPQDPTLQQVFDHVARHMLKQGKRCSDGDTKSSNGCMLALGRKRCAIGCLLGARQIKAAKASGLNRGSIWDPDVAALVADSIGVTELTPLALNLLDRLQRIHDNRIQFGWPDVLRSLALEWGFDPKAVKP